MLFRLHLKANMMSGWEEAYVAYTVVVDAIEQRQRRGSALPRSDSRASVGSNANNSFPGGNLAESGLLSTPLLPRAPSSAALEDAGERAVACARLLWAELERVDCYCAEAVHELVEAIGLIYEEANHGMPVPTLAGRSQAASSAFTIMRSCQMEGLEQALRDLYKSCFVLMQVSSLNYVGFRKLLKKARKQLGKEACKNAGMPDQEQLKTRSFYLERGPHESAETQAFFLAVEKIEECYAARFTAGDKPRARAVLRALRRPPAKKNEVLLMGGLLGAMAVLAMWALWLLTLPDDSECPFCNAYLLDTLPAFRILLVPVAWVWIWAVCCKIWEEHAINHIYIMDCDQQTALGSVRSFRFAGILTVLLFLFLVLYLVGIRSADSWRLVYPPLYPLSLLIFCAVNLMGAPIGSTFSSTRRYFLACLARSALAPLFEVRFRENFVADVMTSMVVILRDMATMVFFYMDGGATGMPSGESRVIAQLWTGPLITALPYWWRLLQCLRRWHDTKHGDPMGKLHLINAGKYFVSLATIALAGAGCYHGCSHFYPDRDKWTKGRIAWFSCMVVGTVYSYLWDILMDWSLLERVPEQEGGSSFGPFPKLRLRVKRGYPSTWFYYFAACSNLIGRLMWTATIQVHVAGHNGMWPQTFTTVVALVEVMRRGQWAVLRLENEHMSNASAYRSVGDVPLMVELAERQLGRRNKAAEAEHEEHHRRCWSLLEMCSSVRGMLVLLLTCGLSAAAVYVINFASHSS